MAVFQFSVEPRNAPWPGDTCPEPRTSERCGTWLQQTRGRQFLGKALPTGGREGNYADIYSVKDEKAETLISWTREKGAEIIDQGWFEVWLIFPRRCAISTCARLEREPRSAGYLKARLPTGNYTFPRKIPGIRKRRKNDSRANHHVENVQLGVMNQRGHRDSYARGPRTCSTYICTRDVEKGNPHETWFQH